MPFGKLEFKHSWQHRAPSMHKSNVVQVLPKPQSCDKLFSPLQTPELSTWNWDGQAGRQRPCRAPSPGRWGCRTSSGSRHCRHRAAPGPAQERQDGWQPGHRGESHQSHSFPREKGKGQPSQTQGQGPTASGPAFYNRRGILEKYFAVTPLAPKERLFP